MPKIRYKEIRLNPERAALVQQAIELVDNYAAQGYQLTLRQLYYQFVSRDLLPQSWADATTGSTNNERSYKKLGDVIGDARMAGLIDWTAIEDRTRNVDGNSHWENPAEIVATCARQFQLDKWSDQPKRVEVWVEKDALEGVVGKAARDLDVQFFSCRGYASMTSLWDAGQRLKRYSLNGQTPVILHLGDHDPSGIDMSRDIQERVAQFMDNEGDNLEFERLALNQDQIDQYNPPPNPAKVSDTRFASYQSLHGDECWELDALEPSVIENLIRTAVLRHRNGRRFNARAQEEETHKQNLQVAADHWNGELVQVLRDLATPYDPDAGDEE